MEKKERERVIIDDTEMFSIFALFDKFNMHPERLTVAEKRKIVEYGISI
jgi:hypothetical protein